MSQKEVRLIPFTVNKITDQEAKIPAGVSMIGAQELWDEGYQGEGIVVAVLDTGCQLDHPDLKGRIIGGRNYTQDNNADPKNYADTNGHGTHVAGTIAADGTSSLFGIAPKAKLLIIKVLDSEGSGTYEGIINGIEYAIRWRGKNGERVRVMNLSLGGAADVSALHKVIRSAVNRNILVVCAAGNEGDGNESTNEFAYPGAYNEVIEIGAVNIEKKLAPFSNNNNELDAVAPGVNVLSTYPGSQYARFSGTSMASPHVAGALALLIEKSEDLFQRSMSEAEIYAQLIKHTESIGYPPSSVGNGLIRLDLFNRLGQLNES